jgi:SWI/SNF complex component SWP82
MESPKDMVADPMNTEPKTENLGVIREQAESDLKVEVQPEEVPKEEVSQHENELTADPSEPIERDFCQAESSLPENTPENPQPTLFKVDKTDLQAHTRYVRSFPKNPSPKSIKLPQFADQEKLTLDGDEYENLKVSRKGEQKVTRNGFLLGGRKYVFNTFTLPGRGKRLFVLATEAAKMLNFRDAFLLCSRTKQLYKYPASDSERQFLDECGFSVSKIRQRSVGVLSARGLFMNFGARTIINGKRVVDDYWEELAMQQGFTDENQVFPVDKNYGARASNHQRKDHPKKITKPVSSKVLMVHPIPPLEDRREYLQNSGKGEITQVLPGQGITGGVELANVSSIPKYKNENGLTMKGDSKHTINKTLSALLDNGPGPTISSSGLNKLPINDDLAGDKSSMGLPYYKRNVLKRVLEEDLAKLKEIEYLHSTVEINNFVNTIRTQRMRQWPYYWQVKAGVELGTTKENIGEFAEQKEEFLKHEETETHFNEYLNCDQVMTKKRKPNPNYFGRGNLSGLKPPYSEKPVIQVQVQETQAMASAFAMQPGQSIPGYLHQQQQEQAEQRFARAQAQAEAQAQAQAQVHADGLTSGYGGIIH